MMKCCPSSAPLVHCSMPYHFTISVDSACDGAVGTGARCVAAGSFLGTGAAGGTGVESEGRRGGTFAVIWASYSGPRAAAGGEGVPAKVRRTSAVAPGTSTTTNNRVMAHRATLPNNPQPPPQSPH